MGNIMSNKRGWQQIHKATLRRKSLKAVLSEVVGASIALAGTVFMAAMIVLYTPIEVRHEIVRQFNWLTQ